MRDNRDSEIRPGDTVVYNFSGELALGSVISVTHGEQDRWGRWRDVKIKITRKFPTRESYGKSKSFVSTVTNPKNVMVIREH